MRSFHALHLAALCAAVLLLFGCGSVISVPGGLDGALRPGVGAHPATGVGVGDQLAGIGHWCIYLGAVAFLVAALARAACCFPPTAFLLPCEGLFTEAGALAVVAILAGAALVWVGLHVWLLGAVLAGLAVVLAIRWRGPLVRLLRRVATPAPLAPSPVKAIP